MLKALQEIPAMMEDDVEAAEQEMFTETPRAISDASDSVTKFFNSTGYHQQMEQQLGSLKQQPPAMVY